MSAAIAYKVIPCSEGGMIQLPHYMTGLSKRLLENIRSREEGRLDNLKLEVRHEDKRYRVWLARPLVENLVTIEQTIEGSEGYFVVHQYVAR